MVPQHGPERRGIADRDLCDDGEPVALVEGPVTRTARFEVGGQVVAVAAGQPLPEEPRTVTLSLTAWVHADERQVPARLARVVLVHLKLSSQSSLCLRRSEPPPAGGQSYRRAAG